MGCSGSKLARRRRGQAPYARTQSLPVHSGCSSVKIIDSNRHIVALTSSTLGSLGLDSDCVSVFSDDDPIKTTYDANSSRASRIENIYSAKAWLEMIDNEISRTQCNARASKPEAIDANWELIDNQINGTPGGDSASASEPEMIINTWELMEGLEEAEADIDETAVRPSWTQKTGPESAIISDFDPDIISNFRKALDELSPQHQILLKASPEPARNSLASNKKFTGIVKARIDAFQQEIDAKREKKCLPYGERKVVLYFTSLRGIRKTYEDCWSVRVILQGYGVKVDERDVSIHGGFKEELNEILGPGFGGSQLPRVFANGNYLGGAEEVQSMHENGELGKALEECEVVVIGEGGGGEVCEGCGGVRFVPCEACSGSCKVFVEVEEEEMVVAGGFRRCPDCNENGLVRCLYCL